MATSAPSMPGCWSPMTTASSAPECRDAARYRLDGSQRDGSFSGVRQCGSGPGCGCGSAGEGKNMKLYVAAVAVLALACFGCNKANEPSVVAAAPAPERPPTAPPAAAPETIVASGPIVVENQVDVAALR